jgi:hypothetical protein
MPVLERAEGPVMAGDVVLVASSAIGFAALARDTGAVRWQRRGEEQPQRPIVRGDVVLLPGRCSEAIDEAPADAAIAGCVDEVALATGELRRRRWVVAPGPAQRPTVLGMIDDRLIWGADGVVWIEGDVPTVVARQADSEMPLAVAATPTGAIVIWRGGVEIAARDEAGAYRSVARRRFSERVLRGVTQPVIVGEVAAVVVDDVLQGWRVDTGKVVWRATARMSFAPGSLVGGERLRAIALDGGIHVIEVDPASGAILREGERRPGLQAASVRFGAAGDAVVAVRPTTSLLHDQVMYFDAAHAHRWTWEVPTPSAARLDPVGVDGGGDHVFAFYDGREVARLAVSATP